MRIDAHNHFWRYDPKVHSWISDEMSVIKRDFLPDDIRPLLVENNLDGCIAVQADQTEEETCFLLELAHQNDFVKGVVGWVDLCASNIADRLAHFSTFEKLVGFRHIVQAEPDPDFLLRPDFQRGLSLLPEFGFTYDILIFIHQLPSVLKTVSMHPDQKFIIDHLAKPCIRKSEIKEWEQLMKAIGQHENVYCKLSGMVTEANWRDWKKEDFTPYLDVILNSFGTDRVMYGSDWPVCLVAADYHEVVRILSDYLQTYTTEEKDKIFGLNAMDFYDISQESLLRVGS